MARTTAILLLAVAGHVSAQSLSVGDPFEDYLRLLQITGRAEAGSLTVRPVTGWAVPGGWSGPAHPWSEREPGVGLEEGEGFSISLIDPRQTVYVNSHFPDGQNDGAIWQGRGVTTSTELGIHAAWSRLSLILRPQLLFSENRDFDLAPVTVANASEYAYPWHIIDLPQRFGPDPIWTLDPGNSEVRVALGRASLGASTSNLWWGPGVRNAIVMSNNAPGFPHAFLSTHSPLQTPIGSLEGQWIWGRLQQSDWFAPVVPNEDDRFITGIVISYSPSFLAGLTLGISRVFTVLVPDGGVPLGDYFAVFRGVRRRTTGDDQHDQLASLFGRWALARSGFEVYWEWARNDHSWELRDYLLEPEHSQAYLMGLQKGIDLADGRMLALRAELTHLEADPTFQVRPKGTYYQHAPVTQGYTHKGQIIGAGIGPGGNAQFVGADLYASWGRTGVYVERRVHDNDAYYTWAADNNRTYCCHDVSLDVGTHVLIFTGDFDLGGGLLVTREYNRYFFGDDLWNLNLSFSARWRAQRLEL